MHACARSPTVTISGLLWKCWKKATPTCAGEQLWEHRSGSDGGRSAELRAAVQSHYEAYVAWGRSSGEAQRRQCRREVREYVERLYHLLEPDLRAGRWLPALDS